METGKWILEKGRLKIATRKGKMDTGLKWVEKVQICSNCWTVQCLTVQWLDSDVSNCPMVGHLCIQLSNGLIVCV